MTATAPLSPATPALPEASFSLLQVKDFHRACKEFDVGPDGKLVEVEPPYNAGKYFHVYHSSTPDLLDELRPALAPRNVHEWRGCLNDLLLRRDLYIIRAAPRTPLSFRVPQRKTTKVDARTGELPSFVDVPRDWLVFDIDSFEEPGTSMADPEAALRHLFDKYVPELIDVTCCYRPSASACIKSGLRLHVLACSERPEDSETFAALIESINRRAGRRLVDHGMARAHLPFYTAMPILPDGFADPVADRSWKIFVGTREAFAVPEIERRPPRRLAQRTPSRSTTPSVDESPGATPAPPVHDDDRRDAERRLDRQIDRIRYAEYPYTGGVAYHDLSNDPVYYLGRLAHLLGGVDAVEDLICEAIDERFDKVDDSAFPDADGDRDSAKHKVHVALRDGSYDPWQPDERPSKPYYPPEHALLAEARAQLAHAVARVSIRDVVIQGVPGVGKTEATLGYIARTDRPVDIAVPTLALAEQLARDLAERIGASNVQVVRARSAPLLGPDGNPVFTGAGPDTDVERMCKKHVVADRIAKLHLAVLPTLCGILGRTLTCEYRSGCPYHEQFTQSPRVRVFAHPYLARRPSSMERRPLLVIDESFYQTIVLRENVPLVDLFRWRETLGASIASGKNEWPYSAFIWERPGMTISYRVAMFQLIDALLVQGNDLLARLRAAELGVRRLVALADHEEQILRRELGVRVTDPHLTQSKAASKHRPSGAHQRLLLCRALADEIEVAGERSMAHSVHHTTDSDGEPVLRICARIALDRGASLRGERVQTHVLHLDADADERVLRPVFSRHQRNPFDLIAIRAERYGYVLQCSDQSGSRAFFNDPIAHGWLNRIAAAKEHDRAGLNAQARRHLTSIPETELSRQARRQRQVLALVEREAADGRRVLVVVTKRIMRQLLLLRSFPNNVAVTYLAQLKGRNDWKDFDTVIAVGREQGSFQDAEDLARAFFFDDPEPLQLMTDRRLSKEWRGVRMRDGSVPAHEVTRHPDDRVQVFVELVRERGLVQAIDRVRGVQRAKNPPRIILLTSVVIDVTVDERATFDDITLGTPAAQAYVRAGGVLPLAPEHLRAVHGVGPREARNPRRPPPGGWDRYLALNPELRPPRQRLYRKEGQRRPSFAWVDERLSDAEAAAALSRVLGEPVVECVSDVAGDDDSA